jgi:hypothetical protein
MSCSTWDLLSRIRTDQHRLSRPALVAGFFLSRVTSRAVARSPCFKTYRLVAVVLVCLFLTYMTRAVVPFC